MPHTRSHGPADGAGSDTAGNFPARQPVSDQTQQSAVPQIEDNQCDMDVPANLQDVKIVQLRAVVARAKKDIDLLATDVEEQVAVVAAAQGKDTPAATILEYKRELKSLIDEGDVFTKHLIAKNGDLTERLDMLVHAASEGSEIHNRATALRNTLVGDESNYRGKFRKLRVQHESLLNGVGVPPSASSSSSSSAPRSRKEYEYLKPALLSIDCNKRELQKFITDAKIWIEKTLSETERNESGMVLAALRSVLDADWADFLERHPDIKTLDFDKVSSLLHKHYLEKNPLVIQRIKALNVRKAKDESISDLLIRLIDQYAAAELEACPVQSLILLHLLTLLPSDPVAEKVKNYLVETMRVEPNIKSLEKATVFIQQQESDSIAKKVGKEDTRVNIVRKKQILCKICGKTHEKFKCLYRCKHCEKPGHKHEDCWRELIYFSVRGFQGFLLG